MSIWIIGKAPVGHGPCAGGIKQVKLKSEADILSSNLTILKQKNS